MTSAPEGLSDIATLWKQALSLHQAGRLIDAERACRQILQIEPEHFDSLHLLGVICGQCGDYAGAVRTINRALEINPNEAAAYLNRGTALKKLKRLGEALASFDKAIALKPNFASAFHNRGGVLAELELLDEALANYSRAVALKPDYAEAFFNRGNALLGLKRADKALASYDRAITLKPDYAEAFNNRGAALTELKRLDEALASHDRAVALKPNYAEAFLSRGNALLELKRVDEALASYDRAFALKPDYAEALHNRGIALAELKRFDEALASHDRAVALKPDYAEAFNNRGVALKELKQLDEALASYDRAISLKPDFAEAFNNKGNALLELNHFHEALVSYDRAIALKPDYAESFNNRGVVLTKLNRFDDALASYQRALALRPEFAGAYCNLGDMLTKQGRTDEAITSYDRAIALKPDFAAARFAVCMAQLPVLYRDEPEIARRRAAYEKHLNALCEEVSSGSLQGDLTNGIAASQPFYLPYQGYNDRDLQSRYGSLVCRIMAERYPPAASTKSPGQHEPVRVGIVSGYFRHHASLRITAKGWLSQLDRRRFQAFGYHTGTQQDAETKTLASFCDRFVQGPLPLDRWREVILADAPHVLIYPEVGMDPVAALLAAQRLAPIQCNSWGHPETSGFPTIDYFLSSDLMEPPDGQDHYTERLIRLPNLSTYLEPLDPPPISLSRFDLGLRPTATVYWCGQSLFKYLPQYDHVFPRIAREVGDCQFAFVQYQLDGGSHVNELFWERLNRAFDAFGLRAADYCVMWPRAGLQRYVAAIGQCDIVLDSIGWSGCNTTLDAMTYDLPVVTMPGALMRGRHGMAFLTMMGLTETITDSIDNYVSTAVRLAPDASWRMAIKNKLSENKQRLYRDKTCIVALEEFLDRVARL